METKNTHKDYLKQLRTATAVSGLLGNDLSKRIAETTAISDNVLPAEVLEESWAVKDDIDIQVLSEAFTTALGHVRNHRQMSQPSPLSEQDRIKLKWKIRLSAAQRCINYWRGSVSMQLYWPLSGWGGNVFPQEDSPNEIFAEDWLAQTNQSPIEWKKKNLGGNDLLCMICVNLKFFTEVMPFFNGGRSYDFGNPPQLEKLRQRSTSAGSPYQYLVTSIGEPQNWYENSTGQIETENNIWLRPFWGIEVFGPSNDKRLMLNRHWVAYMGDSVDPYESVTAVNNSPVRAYQMLRKRIAKHVMAEL